MNSTPDPIDPTAEFLLELDGAADAVAADESTVTESDESTVTTVTESDADAPVEPDPRLLEAHDLALAALREITPESSIGEPVDYRVEADGVVSLRFANRLAGYPGWFWTVSLARVEDAEPTVLEVELLPGDGALLAPEWVPWAVRLADYHAAQAALAEAASAEGDDDAHDDGDLDDVDDLDAADYDDDGSPILHAGDLDGVDIDELSDDADDDADEDDSEDDDDSDEDDSDEDESDDDDSDDDDESDEDDGDESD